MAKDPEALANAMGMSEEELKSMSPEDLIKYFLDRLKEQTEAHRGGSRWIGTRGTSPVGHSGYHPGGMRVGGTLHEPLCRQGGDGPKVQGLFLGRPPDSGANG